MPVHYELDESVAIVAIDRPKVANAIDRPTAETLADAFRRGCAHRIERKVLWGADLKAMR